jgi:hypothetical protein
MYGNLFAGIAATDLSVASAAVDAAQAAVGPWATGVTAHLETQYVSVSW